MPVAETLGRKADPLSGSSARKTNHVFLKKKSFQEDFCASCFTDSLDSVTESNDGSHRSKEGDVIGLALPLCHRGGGGELDLQSLPDPLVDLQFTIVHSNRNSNVQ